LREGRVAHLALAVCVTIALLLAGPSSGQTARLVLEPTARAIAQANRPDASRMYDAEMTTAFARLLYPYRDFADELGREELGGVPTGPINRPSTISPEDATWEVDWVFRVLKYGYAGYQCFGGDEAFLAAKGRILQDLGERSSDLSTEEYESLICGHLGFIQDGHLSLGRTRLCEFYSLFWNPKYEFRRDDAGFFIAASDGIRRAASIEGDDPCSYLKPSISETGDIIYVPGIVRPRLDAGFTINVKYRDGHSEAIRLDPMVSTAQGGPAYELGAIDGIPLLACRSFGPSGADLDALNAFVDDVSRLRDERVIVLDIRSNPGGSSQYPTAWLWRLMYQLPREQQIYANLTTETAAALLDSMLSSYSDEAQTPKDAAAFLRHDASSSRPGWSNILHAAGAVVNNGPFIAVITDSYIASAAEDLVLGLRHTDNVVFIGASTRGALSTGTVGMCWLPISRLSMRVPVVLNRVEDMTNRDGLGLFPDFWVDPNNAVERTVRFLREHLVPDSPEQPQR